ncbi:hypothetical protein NMY22_g17431 [Coprinellus aureogranulatus]|nr:hypothetical protein NMY22_g17431 [Coprinellus aureogranulatus]
MATTTTAEQTTLAYAKYGKTNVRVFRIVRGEGGVHTVVEYSVETLLEGDIETSEVNPPPSPASRLLILNHCYAASLMLPNKPVIFPCEHKDTSQRLSALGDIQARAGTGDYEIALGLSTNDLPVSERTLSEVPLRFFIGYTQADNSVVVATDSVKNITYFLAKTSPHILSPEKFALHIGTFFVSKYAHIHKVHVTVNQLRWSRITVDGKEHRHSFYRDGEDKRVVKAVVDATQGKHAITASLTSGLTDLLVLKSTGSAFENFYRDEFTTLAEVDDRIFSTSVDLSYSFSDIKIVAPQDEKKLEFQVPMKQGDEGFAGSVWDDSVAERARTATLEVFATDESASVQATLYKMGQRVIAENAGIKEVTYTLPNKHYIPVDMKYIGIDNLTPLRLCTSQNRTICQPVRHDQVKPQIETKSLAACCPHPSPRRGCLSHLEVLFGSGGSATNGRNDDYGTRAAKTRLAMATATANSAFGAVWYGAKAGGVSFPFIPSDFSSLLSCFIPDSSSASHLFCVSLLPPYIPAFSPSVVPGVASLRVRERASSTSLGSLFVNLPSPSSAFSFEFFPGHLLNLSGFAVAFLPPSSFLICFLFILFFSSSWTWVPASLGWESGCIIRLLSEHELLLSGCLAVCCVNDDDDAIAQRVPPRTLARGSVYGRSKRVYTGRCSATPARALTSRGGLFMLSLLCDLISFPFVWIPVKECGFPISFIHSRNTPAASTSSFLDLDRHHCAVRSVGGGECPITASVFFESLLVLHGAGTFAGVREPSVLAWMHEPCSSLPSGPSSLLRLPSPSASPFISSNGFTHPPSAAAAPSSPANHRSRLGTPTPDWLARRQPIVTPACDHHPGERNCEDVANGAEASVSSS